MRCLRLVIRVNACTLLVVAAGWMLGGAAADQPFGDVAEVGDVLRPDSDLLTCNADGEVISGNLDYSVGDVQAPDLRAPEQVVADVLTFEGHPQLAALDMVTVYARGGYRQIAVSGPQGIVAAFTFEPVPGVQHGRPVLSRYSRCNSYGVFHK